MGSEEIQQLITELRRMLVENGFGWVVEEAEADLMPISALKTRAFALIDAVEGATTHLAEVELSALAALEVEDINFEPDGEAFAEEGELLGETTETTEFFGVGRLRGTQRRTQLELLAEKRATFAMLRRRVDDNE